MKDMAANPVQVGSLESQIQALESNRSSLQFVIDTLTQADVTVLDLINFIEKNQSNIVTIISVDTMDMLPTGTSIRATSVTGTAADAVAATEGEDGEEAYVSGGRGYSRTDSAAIAYYDKLFNSGLAYEPLLDGLEKYILPNGEEVYIFEISLGGVVA